MLRTGFLPVFTLIVIFFLVSLGCQLFSGAPAALETLPTSLPLLPGQVNPPTAPLPEASPTVGELEPPTPGLESTQESAEPAAPSPGTIPLEGEPCAEEVCTLAGSFLLARPIGEGGRDTIVPSSRYGSYQKATRRAQTGVYFLNSNGTPVLAAADGTVAFAGNDREVPMGPFKNLYGQVVILEHSFPELEQPLFTVYAHLSEVDVEKGDQVSAGQEIGEVGSSGSATGSILLFEVRLGENHFQSTRNPELWLKPHLDAEGQPRGAIAGRIENKNGKAIQLDNIVLEQMAGPGLPAIEQFYLATYTGKRQEGQPPWTENFAISDLPPGEYQISFLGDGVQTQLVTVEPGRLSLVTIVLND